MLENKQRHLRLNCYCVLLDTVTSAWYRITWNKNGVMNRGAYLYSSLVSQYQKLHILMQMENCGDFSVFLGAFIK